MKSDVEAILQERMPVKRPSKETLNHPGLIKLASGLDPYTDTQMAYLRAYQALGIDIINRIPECNAPSPTPPGMTKKYNRDYFQSYLGVYDTFCRTQYPFTDSDEFFKSHGVELSYDSLITPVPHHLDINEIHTKEAITGDIGIYYYQLYTTLFMWGVEVLGWEVFMTAAMTDPEGFDELFLEPAFEKSKQLIEVLCRAHSPFVFVHDDLADKNGPVFRPSFYETYIFPRYKKLWEPVKNAGKKLIFVADGNMTALLDNIKSTGVDGVMIETPATPLDILMDYFADSIIIGGIDTMELTFGTPDSIRRHVLDICRRVEDMSGFVMSSSGGIHGNIPLENLEAYFDARVETGFTPSGWRNL